MKMMRGVRVVSKRLTSDGRLEVTIAVERTVTPEASQGAPHGGSGTAT